MKNTVKIILLLILPVLAAAQPHESELERLQENLKNTANGTISVNAYMNLALYYNTINPDSALYYLGKGLSVAQKLKLK
jgi:hypothetical protein